MTTYAKARALRWVSGEPIPGLVEVEITDASGTAWRFIDKYPMFGKVPELNSATAYPVDLLLACEVLRRDTHGVVVSTAEPWGLEAIDGTYVFTLNPESLVELASE